MILLFPRFFFGRSHQLDMRTAMTELQVTGDSFPAPKNSRERDHLGRGAPTKMIVPRGLPCHHLSFNPKQLETPEKSPRVSNTWKIFRVPEFYPWISSWCLLWWTPSNHLNLVKKTPQKHAGIVNHGNLMGTPPYATFTPRK